MNHTMENHASLSFLSLELEISGCRSLKEKRGRLAAILTRIRQEFNVAAAETGYQDAWQSALLSIVIVSNDPDHNRQVLQRVCEFIEARFPDEPVMTHTIESR